MIEVGIQFIIFFIIALCSGLLFPAFYAIIGSPQYFPHPEIGHNFPNVQQLGVSKNGMIFRWYGGWLCRKQNEFEHDHDKTRRHAIPIGAKYGANIILRTSYGRIVKMTQSECRSEYAVLLPGETGMIEYVNTNNAEKSERLAALLWASRASMPISPYKAFGLCSVCTSFWFMAFSLLAGYHIGLFPIQMFWLSPMAYAVTAWASQAYEI